MTGMMDGKLCNQTEAVRCVTWVGNPSELEGKLPDGSRYLSDTVVLSLTILAAGLK